MKNYTLLREEKMKIGLIWSMIFAHILFVATKKFFGWDDVWSWDPLLLWVLFQMVFAILTFLVAGVMSKPGTRRKSPFSISFLTQSAKATGGQFMGKNEAQKFIANLDDDGEERRSNGNG